MNKQFITTVNGIEIAAVCDENHNFFVPIKPICQAIGIDDSAQRHRIDRHYILHSVEVTMTSTGADGKTYDMVCLPLEYVYGWLFTIDANLVAEANRENVKRYQLECYQALYTHFAGSLRRRVEENEAEGEDSEELLTARRKVIQEAYAANKRIKKEYPRGIMYKQSDAVNGFLWGLFGSKCLPDEEPKPAEPKFKVGDKVRIVDDSRHGQKYRGDVTEVVYVDESDPDATYKVDIYDEECGGGLWYSESDLEPYTEPKEREENAQERATLTDDCQSQCKSHHIGDANDMIDDIIKNSFREHNRLHIAAQIVAAIYANYQAAKGFKSIEELVCKALDITDTLIKESEKGGAK